MISIYKARQLASSDLSPTSADEEVFPTAIANRLSSGNLINEISKANNFQSLLPLSIENSVDDKIRPNGTTMK